MQICVCICVYVDKSRKSQEKCDISPGNVVTRYPAATFYKSRSPGMFNLSKSWGRSQLQYPFVKIRNYAAMTSRTAERLLNSIKAALFPTRIVNLSFITSEQLRYTRLCCVPQYNKLRSNFEDKAAWSPIEVTTDDIHGISILYREIISERNVSSNKWLSDVKTCIRSESLRGWRNLHLNQIWIHSHELAITKMRIFKFYQIILHLYLCEKYLITSWLNIFHTFINEK